MITIEGERTRESLRASTSVWFRTLEGVKRPVFHDVHTHHWSSKTYCGVETVVRYVEPAYSHPRGVRVPLRRAQMIGLPCKRCWP